MLSATLILLLLPIASSLRNFPIVHTSYGAVRGYEYRAKNGFVGEIFKKIPYAVPPIGERRWKKPMPPKRWNYTLDGTFFGPACAQVPSYWKPYVTGFSEDCLTLNVYTSRKCRESNATCPVVLYIHGGATLFSGITMFPDEALVTNYATQGVIMVTVAFRIGVFGAMALGDENALPANLALHDILESLRFVNNEIHNFGGDKDQITVMGHSSGGAIVLALVFSPSFNKAHETPLFSRAIVMSASATYESEEKQTRASHGVATKLGCSGTAQEIIACMLPLSMEAITNAAFEVGGTDLFSLTQISGTTAAGELMPIHNMKELRQQQKEHMSQIAGSTPTKLLIGSILDEFGSDAFNQNGGLEVVVGYHVGDVLGVRNVDECTQKYFSDVKSGKFDPGRYDVLSQTIFVSNSLFASTQTRAGAEVYVYQWDYPAHAKHGDDLYFVMGRPLGALDENEEWLGRVYPTYFTNFIRGLAPDPDWTPLEPELMNYYSINKSLTDGTTPELKFGYHQDIADYYAGMIKFDDNLTEMKKMLLNSPVQTKNLVILSAESFNFRDIIVYGTILGVLMFLVRHLYRFRRTGRKTVDNNIGSKNEYLDLP